MCDNKVCIANVTPHRHITLCVHSTIQVSWDNLTLSWNLQDFRNFAAMVKRQLQQQTVPEPSVVLRVNRTIVGWPTPDFYRFADMVMIALFNLDDAIAQLTSRRFTNNKIPNTPALWLN